MKCGHCGAQLRGVEAHNEYECRNTLVQELVELEGKADRLVEAAAAVNLYVVTHGGIENHGHRREGSACEVCQLMNKLDAALRAFAVKGA